MSLLDRIRNRYAAGVFIHSPSNTSTIDILIDTSYSTELPCISITVPVYNQEQIIVENLTSIVQKTSGTFELIIICDACSDATESNILTWHSSLQTVPHLTRVLVLTSSQPLFETSADNLGFFCSRGKYFLEI
jgi:cellulose synthase/poly-beta-1,6-N-acetylglucosamine synthase-like glycosyltransferase